MKSIFFSILLFFFVAGSSCYAQQWLWVKAAGGTTGDYGNGIAADQAGNVFVTGSYQGTATFGASQLTNSGQTDIFIVKYNSSGTVQWAKKAGGTGADEGSAVAVGASGDCYVTGFFSGTATFGSTNLTSANGKNVFIAKYSGSNGSLLWAKSVSVTGDAEGAGITVDASGNCFLTGYFRNTATFKSSPNGISLTSVGGLDMFLAKYNTSGTCKWAKKGGGTGLDRGYGIALNGKNIVVTGYYEATGTFGTTQLTSAGGGDAFVAKYDTAGTFKWAKSFGGANTDYGHAVALDSSGNCYVTGRFETQATFQSTPVTSYGSYDIFLTKLNNNGSLLWVKNYGGLNLDYSRSIAINKNYNAVYITGAYAINAMFDSLNVVSATNSQDVFVAKVDTNGTALWALSGGGLYDDSGNGIALDTVGGIYITGSFYNNATVFGNVSVTGYGDYDIFTAKICPVSASVVKTDVSCYGGSNGSIIITPDGGTPPFTYTWVPNVGTNDTLENLSAGIYAVTVTDNNGCESVKQIVIEQPDSLAVVVTGTNITCHNLNNGLAVAVASGGTSPYNFIWDTTPVQLSDTAFNLSQGNYKAIVTDAYGCKDSATVNVVNPSAVLALVGTNKSTCSGNNTSIGATPTAAGGTPPYKYKWTPSTFLNNDTLANPVATPTANVTYTLKVTDKNGCTASAGMHITITQPPSVMVSQGDTLCVGQTANLAANATGALSYSWTPALTLNNPNIATPVASPTATTTYTVTVQFSGNCYNTGSVKIVVYNLPQITTSGNQIVCAGDSLVLSANNGITYLWQPDSMFYNPAVSNPQTYPLTQDVSFVVTVTDAHSCSNSDTVDITVNPVPTPAIVENAGVLTSNYAIGNQWYLNGALIPNETNQSYTPTQNGDYTVMVTINNCSGISVFYHVINVGDNDTYRDVHLHIYPNPSSGFINIDINLPNTDKANILIKDILGRIIVSKVMSPENNKIHGLLDMKGYGDGPYFIEIHTVKHVFFDKIIITQ